jgi:hypothetical protein
MSKIIFQPLRRNIGSTLSQPFFFISACEHPLLEEITFRISSSEKDTLFAHSFLAIISLKDSITKLGNRPSFASRAFLGVSGSGLASSSIEQFIDHKDFLSPSRSSDLIFLILVRFGIFVKTTDLSDNTRCENYGQSCMLALRSC